MATVYVVCVALCLCAYEFLSDGLPPSAVPGPGLQSQEVDEVEQEEGTCHAGGPVKARQCKEDRAGVH